MKSEPINEIRNNFTKEWLLIAIDKMDEQRTIPLAGRLIAHSPRRHEIYDAMMGRPENLLVTYSEDALPAGYAAAF